MTRHHPGRPDPAEFPDAVCRGHLRIVLQPRRDLATGLARSFEALVRWDHPGLGTLAPGAFLAGIEDAGHGRRLTDWVLREAALQRSRWAGRGVDATVAVNLTAYDTLSHETAERLSRLVGEAGRHPREFVLEVTAAALAAPHGPLVAATLADLRSAGFGLGLDGLGAGTSPGDAGRVARRLLGMARFGIANVDRGMLGRATRDPGSAEASAASAVADACRAAGTVPSALGVEDPRMLLSAMAMGFATGQGHHLDRDARPAASAAARARAA